MGPAFFLVAIQPVLEALIGEEGFQWQGWFLDDGILVGEEAALRLLLARLGSEFLKLGLTVNIAKCTLWSMEARLQQGGDLPTPCPSQPKVVLGIPFGNQIAQGKFLQEVLTKFRRLLKRLSLPLKPKSPSVSLGLSALFTL